MEIERVEKGLERVRRGTRREGRAGGTRCDGKKKWRKILRLEKEWN